MELDFKLLKISQVWLAYKKLSEGKRLVKQFVSKILYIQVYRILSGMRKNHLIKETKKEKSYCTFTAFFFGVGVGLLFGNIISNTPSASFAFTLSGIIFSERGIVW